MRVKGMTKRKGIFTDFRTIMPSLGAQMVKNLPAIQENLGSIPRLG